VRQHARAVQALPPEAVIRQVVVLVPADLDGEEVFQPGLLDQLRQRPGIAEHIRQPQHRRLCPRPEVLPKEAAAQQKLAGQRLRAADVAVGLNPHPTDRLPAPLGHPLPDGREQRRVVLPDKLVKLRLALGEGEVRELIHQAHDVVEGAPGLTPGLAQRPQPGDIKVGMPRADDVHVQRRAGLSHARPEQIKCSGHAGVERLARRFAQVKRPEGGIKGIEQAIAGRVVRLVQPGRAQRHAGQGYKIARGLVDQRQGRGSHVRLGRLVGLQIARPAMQSQNVFPAVAPRRRQDDLLVVAIAGGKRLAINVGQSFGMAEAAGHAQRQEQRRRSLRRPPGRDTETGAHHKILLPAAPVRLRSDHLPAAIVHVRGHQRRDLRAVQCQKTERRQGQVRPVLPGSNQLQPLAEFLFRPTYLVIHTHLHGRRPEDGVQPPEQ